MKHYRFLLVGGGMASDKAVDGILKVDPTGNIGVISNEPNQAYKRPPLSKGLWKGDPPEDVWLNGAKDHGEVHASRMATRIDLKAKQVVDSQGDVYSYEKLLLATGGRVRKLPFEAEGIIYFRTFEDYTNLRRIAEKGDKIVVIGGSFIGSEIAAALTMNKKQATMIFPGKGIGERVYPPALVQFINSYFRSKGVKVLAGENFVRSWL